jgi:hypothetical protein
MKRLPMEPTPGAADAVQGANDHPIPLRGPSLQCAEPPFDLQTEKFDKPERGPSKI